MEHSSADRLGDLLLGLSLNRGLINDHYRNAVSYRSNSGPPGLNWSSSGELTHGSGSVHEDNSYPGSVSRVRDTRVVYRVLNERQLGFLVVFEGSPARALKATFYRVPLLKASIKRLRVLFTKGSLIRLSFFWFKA